MGAGEDVEGLLKIAVVRQRTSMSGEQRPVSGMSDAGLFEHGDRLGFLSGGAERLAELQGGVGVLGVGAETIASKLEVAPRVGGAAGVGFFSQRSRDVGGARGLAATQPQQQDRGRRCECSASCEAIMVAQLREHGA